MIKTKTISLSVLLVFVAAAAGLFWLGGSLHKPLVLQGDEVIEIRPGGSLAGVMAQLTERGVLGEGTDALLRRMSVRGYNLLTDVSKRLHVGEYRLREDDTLITLLNRFERGDVIQRSFTLIEGWNIRDLRHALLNAPGLKSSLSELNDQQLMARLGLPDEHPEGWFAADTYFYTAGETDIDILTRALQRQQNVLQRLWSGRAADLPYDKPYDALIMASIVEKETGDPTEREEIAGVFVERLARGMRLQTDPTVIYGMGEAYKGNIRRADLQRPTPYNTYVIRGMPPTPIAMPGEAAIYAALHPAQTDALYFVARGDGSHQFSRTLDEHINAVRKYQLQRRENYRSAPSVEANIENSSAAKTEASAESSNAE